MNRNLPALGKSTLIYIEKGRILIYYVVNYNERLRHAQPAREQGRMSKSSVSIGGSASQSTLVAGDRNEIRLTPETMSHASRETDKVEITHAIRTLRELLEKLDTKDRGKILRALADAGEEAQKPTPDKKEVAGALERVVKYAKTANGIGEVVFELKRPLSIIAGWVGSAAPIAARLFGLAP